jgi:hypothetical protein
MRDPKFLHLLKFYVKLFSIKNRVFWYFNVVLVYKNDKALQTHTSNSLYVSFLYNKTTLKYQNTLFLKENSFT